MKKLFKIMSVLLLSATLFFAVAQPSFAEKKGAEEIITAVETSDSKADATEINTLANTIINFIWIISIIVTVIVIMVIGLKYIIGSTQEKAEYKKSLIPLVVGALLIVFATTIVKFLFIKN